MQLIDQVDFTNISWKQKSRTLSSFNQGSTNVEAREKNLALKDVDTHKVVRERRNSRESSRNSSVRESSESVGQSTRQSITVKTGINVEKFGH